MGRKYLGKNEGMLFKFPNAYQLSFWMRNTYIPLSIAFIDDNGKIFQIEEMIPLNTNRIQSNKDCCYALEVNKDWFKQNNVGIGSKIKGLNKILKIAQQIPYPGLVEEKPVDTPALTELPEDMTSPDQQLPVNPELEDVQVNKTYKEMIEDANIRGKSLIIVYKKKDGFTLPPKIISPPFLFGPNAEGKSNSLVTCWDTQDANWKSFLIDNIIDLEEKQK